MIFYKLTDESQILELLDECIVFFDTNAILELYSYSLSLNKAIKRVLRDNFESRVWTSSQVISEFNYNKYSCIDKIKDKYNSKQDTEALKFMKEALNGEGFIGEYRRKLVKFDNSYSNLRKHPYFEEKSYKDISEWLNETYSKIEKIIKSFEEDYKNIEEIFEKSQVEQIEKIDEIDSEINNLIKDLSKTPEYSIKELATLSKEAEFRFRNKIAPGYADADESSRNGSKPGFQKFGDYYIWSDILKLGVEHKKPLLFISQESRKGDWGIRDLVREYELASGGQQFWKVSLDKFLIYLVTKNMSADGDAYLYLINEIRMRTIENEIGNILEKNFNIDPSSSFAYKEIEDYVMSTINDEIDCEIEFIAPGEIEILEVNLKGEDLSSASAKVRIPFEAQALYYSYWGRDPDTKDVILSPVNYISYIGSFDFVLDVEVEVEELKELKFKIKIIHENISVGDKNISITRSLWDEREDW